VIGTGIGIGTGTGIGIVIEGGDRGQDHVTVIAESISIVQDQEIGIEIGDVHAQEIEGGIGIVDVHAQVIEDEADLEVEAETNIVQRATNHKRWITTAQTMSQMVMEQFPRQWKLI